MRRYIKDGHCVFHEIDSPSDLVHEMKPTKGTFHGFCVLDVARPAAFASALETLHKFTRSAFEAYITSFSFPKNQHRCYIGEQIRTGLIHRQVNDLFLVGATDYVGIVAFGEKAKFVFVPMHVDILSEIAL